MAAARKRTKRTITSIDRPAVRALQKVERLLDRQQAQLDQMRKELNGQQAAIQLMSGTLRDQSPTTQLLQKVFELTTRLTAIEATRKHQAELLAPHRSPVVDPKCPECNRTMTVVDAHPGGQAYVCENCQIPELRNG